MRCNNVLLSRIQIVFIAAFLWGLVFPFAAVGQEASNGIKLPPVYQAKLDDFLVNNNVMKNNNAKTFTMNFVETEMETDWQISKENQLLFIWHSVYKQVTDQDLYNGKDGDQKIAEDFTDKVVNARIKACSQKYRSCFTAYMNQRSAEAQQRSAEAQQNAMKLDSLWLKEDMLRFYDIYTRSPNIVKQEEINFMKKATNVCITQCKQYGIDYRAILLKETGDGKKVDAILKFYGIAY